MEIAIYIPAFVALFVIIDPVGLAPLFAALTQGMDPRERRAVAIRACLVALGILTLFGIAGEAVLNFLGISMPAFRIAGGVLLFLTALDMLFERRAQRRQGQADTAHPADPSVFPLAIPLIAGPGAIATMILLTGQEGGGALHVLAVHGVMAIVLLAVFALFLLAAPLERLLGPTGINVVTRLLGMLLAALSVQFVIDGMRDLQVI
ncbi:MarC family protein [Roseibacterium sp. SDUM158017]|uniref:MarC family protein n=1 Tax=Roseicyclus salinarum TaxID=3036773 RepID=UPI002414FFD4|nr:MarC family protein [Roseibacterium sp. SDUM158017]MDG4648464.1 MarC family protein [Roseibacterium sp. SDUM158017]